MVVLRAVVLRTQPSFAAVIQKCAQICPDARVLSFPDCCGFTHGNMDWLANALAPGGKLLGIEWHFWKVVGWVGNILFTSRFFVQWWATEKHKRVVVPDAFWWLSLSGSGCLLAYGLYRRDSVFIFAYLFTWIPYIRNLIIGHRATRALQPCNTCQASCTPASKFCPECGAKLAVLQSSSSATSC